MKKSINNFVRTQDAINYNDCKNFRIFVFAKVHFCFLRKQIISTKLAVVKYNIGLEGITMFKKLKN